MDGVLPPWYHNVVIGSLRIALRHPASLVAYCQTTLSQTAPPSGSLTADDYELIWGALVAFIIVGLLLSSFSRHTNEFLGEDDRLQSKTSELDWLIGEREQNPDPATLRYSQQEFEEMVSNALDEIPPEFETEWKNVAVTVSTGYATDEEKKKMGVPQHHLILGLYSGLLAHAESVPTTQVMSLCSINRHSNCFAAQTKKNWCGKYAEWCSTNWHTI